MQVINSIKNDFYQILQLYILCQALNKIFTFKDSPDLIAKLEIVEILLEKMNSCDIG